MPSRIDCAKRSSSCFFRAVPVSIRQPSAPIVSVLDSSTTRVSWVRNPSVAFLLVLGLLDLGPDQISISTYVITKLVTSSWYLLQVAPLTDELQKGRRVSRLISLHLSPSVPLFLYSRSVSLATNFVDESVCELQMMLRGGIQWPRK